MPSYNLNHLAISVDKKGADRFIKSSTPTRVGVYAEIRTRDYEFHFNLNGEIKFIRGLDVNWPHPAEQLKRTDGNDWVCYSVGDHSSEYRIVTWLGEYYLPCLSYPSNSVWEVNYQSNPDIMAAFAAWYQLYANLYGMRQDGLNANVKELINCILLNDDRMLHERSQKLNAIIGGRVSVLPPDTRHVDYEIIPLIVADGCLYHCGFCCVKTAQNFKVRSQKEIVEQIRQLKAFYGRNLENYNALFLGNHDALGAGSERICLAALEAAKAFGFGEPRKIVPSLFLFGSVDSLLRSKNELFDKLSNLPFHTCINIGFESIDPSTLYLIRKPVSASKVREAFKKGLEINATYKNIEVTGNFLMGETLPAEHYNSLAGLLEAKSDHQNGQVPVYLSPIKDSPKKRELLPRFLEIKNRSQMPVYIYLIQRL